MPRKSPIKWRDSDTAKLENEIERFNSKIYRTRNRHPELADILPNTIKKQDKLQMIEEFKNNPRSEFNNKLRELERFSKRGAEQRTTNDKGFSTTKWERKEMSYDIAQLNRSRTIERKKAEAMEATSQGQKIGFKRGEMGSERLNELKAKAFDFNKIRSRYEWEKLKTSVTKQIKPDAKEKSLEQYKQNYLSAIERAYGEYGKNVYDIVNSLPSNVVVETFYKDQEATIDFHYERIDMTFKLELLEKLWGGVSSEVHG